MFDLFESDFSRFVRRRIDERDWPAEWETTCVSITYETPLLTSCEDGCGAPLKGLTCRYCGRNYDPMRRRG